MAILHGIDDENSSSEKFRIFYIWSDGTLNPYSSSTG